MIGAMPGVIVVSGALVILAALLLAPEGTLKDVQTEQWLASLEFPVNLAVVILPGQLFFILAAVLPALLSKQEWKTRLGLVKPAISTRTWVILALATPIIKLLCLAFGSIFFNLAEPTPQLKMLEELLTGHTGVGLVLVLLCAGALPGMSEELFFRGFVQVGLLRRHGFVLAIGAPAIFFAAAHLDPMHATTVLPLGIWFGLLSWWSRSVIPSMCAHAINNSFAIGSSALAGPESPPKDTVEMITHTQGVVWVAYTMALVLLVVGLLRLRGERAQP